MPLTGARQEAPMSGHADGNHGLARPLDHQAGTARIFIVHLRLDADPAQGHLAGRIQHVQSSDAMHFDSTDELVAFISGHVTARPV
jgi:hypothetical protein